jgi:hypothetical protein
LRNISDILKTYSFAWILGILCATGCMGKTEHIKCPAFSYDELGFDDSYFMKTLLYTNGRDTMRLNCDHCDASGPHEYDRGNGFVGDCTPALSIQYIDSARQNYISFNFLSRPLFSQSNYLSIYVLTNRIELDRDTINLSVQQPVYLQHIDSSNEWNDPNIDEVTCFELKDWRVTYFEMESGESWHLVEVIDIYKSLSDSIPLDPRLYNRNSN